MSQRCIAISFIDQNQEGRKERFYLMTHTTYFIYGYVALTLW